MRGSKKPVLKNFFKKIFLENNFWGILNEGYSMGDTQWGILNEGTIKPVLKNFFRKIFLGYIFEIEI